MSQITPLLKNQFQDLGYLIIPMPVNRADVAAALQGVTKMRHDAIQKKYPLTRTYYDHISNWNMAAIEAPFNESILDSRVRRLFEKLNLGATVCSLMDWVDTSCSLARLFTMGNYKYRGNWHRDNKITTFENPQKCTNLIQVELYLEAQHGFRYLKKEYDIGGVKSIISNLNQSEIIQKYPLPLSPPRESFEILGGEAGTMLLFNPTRLHQGSTCGHRLDFHLRFHNLANVDIFREKLTQNSFFDFKCVPELGERTNLRRIAEENRLPRTAKRSIKNRVVNTINYWTCLYNLYRVRKFKSLKKTIPLSWTPDLLSNTFFQK
jgi:hypothetical protein